MHVTRYELGSTIESITCYDEPRVSMSEGALIGLSVTGGPCDDAAYEIIAGSSAHGERQRMAISHPGNRICSSVHLAALRLPYVPDRSRITLVEPRIASASH